MNPVDLFNQVKELKTLMVQNNLSKKTKTNLVNTWNRQKACYQVLKVLTVF
ncbi:hypothetical protein [Streptococcus suis]|uniref:hypothetical protein n=1 Tax=Streptococcus suis TaxID=1307 RepID=UPI0003FCCADD|nr:hypothetical protein [Streptococcus suis]